MSFEPEIESAHCVGARPGSWRAVCFRINSGYLQIIFTSILQFLSSGLVSLS